MELLGTKCIGSLGRFVIPSGIRARWELKPNTKIEIHLGGDFLILKKAEGQCLLCGGAVNNDNRIEYIRGNKKIILCNSCYKFLWRRFKEDETKEKIRRIK